MRDLTPMNTEDVFHLSRKDVPNYDGKIHTSGYQVSLVIAGRDLMRVQQTCNFVPMATESSVRGPTCERGWGFKIGRIKSQNASTSKHKHRKS